MSSSASSATTSASGSGTTLSTSFSSATSRSSKSLASSTSNELEVSHPDAELAKQSGVTVVFDKLRVAVPGKKGGCCRRRSPDSTGKVLDSNAVSEAGRPADATDGEDVVLLNSVSGVLRPGTLTMLMGPTGCGKTMLLDALAGRLPSALEFSGTILLNGVELPLGPYSGYALQEDVLNPLATPRENLTFISHLQLPRHLSGAERVERVEAVLHTLGIAHVGDTKVGTPGLDRGLSGGERKRAAIAQALVNQPPVLLIDDPTAGLDAAIAASVVATLHRLAKHTNMTILSTVAQAAPSMLEYFDEVMCMTNGEIAYNGSLDGMVGAFVGLGFEPPVTGLNPADYIVDLLSSNLLASEAAKLHERSMSESEAEAAAADVIARRLAIIHAAAAEHSSIDVDAERRERKDADLTFVDTANEPRAFWTTTLYMLTQRHFQLAMRNSKATVARLMQCIIGAFVFGTLFYNLNLSQTGWRDRMGLIFLSLVFNLFGGLQGTTTVFLADIHVYRRESHERLYSPMSYLVAKVLSDLPVQIVLAFGFTIPLYFLSHLVLTPAKFFFFALICFLCSMLGSTIGLALAAVTRDADATNALAPVILIPSVMFSSYIRNLGSITPVLRWIRHLSLVKYALMSLAISEFKDLKFYCTPDEADGGVCPVADGRAVLANIGAYKDGGLGFDVGILFAMLAAVCILAYFGLRGARTK